MTNQKSQVLDMTWLGDVQDVGHTKFQNRKVVVRDQRGLDDLLIKSLTHSVDLIITTAL
jgi:hypothetical protein